MARKAQTTPCPRCAAPVAIRGAKATCPACGLAVRFVDAPERPCAACGEPLAFPPGKDAVRCGSCGVWQAAEHGRAVVGQAECPRCGRDVAVPLGQEHAVCPRCGAAMLLRDAP